MEIKRTHDAFYVNESFKKNPKRATQYIGDKILSFGFSPDDKKRFLDIGCSNGDFLFYLMEKFPNSDFMGVDVLEGSLNKAKEDFKHFGLTPPPLNILNIETATPSDLAKLGKFDFVSMNGVISIFDDIYKPLQNFTSLLVDDGVGVIMSIFNPYDIDVLIKGRVCGNTHWESGWNLWSQTTVLNMLDELGYHGEFYEDFELDIDLPQQEDLLRSWTVRMENGKRLIVNGLGQILSFGLLKIVKK